MWKQSFTKKMEKIGTFKAHKQCKTEQQNNIKRFHKYQRPSARPSLSQGCMWGGTSLVLCLFSELFHFEKYSRLHYVIRSSRVGTSNCCVSLSDASIYLVFVDGRRRPVTKSQYLTRWTREQAGNTNKRHKHRRPDSDEIHIKVN